jgi:hypothetical protein
MSTCNICGAEGAHYSAFKRQSLCDTCASTTPVKVSFETFRYEMWSRANRTRYGDPGATIERSFYEDYIASTFDLRQYINAVRTILD